MNLDEIELEIECRNCGKEPDIQRWCTTCRGTGKTLTPFGEKVLKMVARQLWVERDGEISYRKADDY